MINIKFRSMVTSGQEGETAMREGVRGFNSIDAVLYYMLVGVMLSPYSLTISEYFQYFLFQKSQA